MKIRKIRKKGAAVALALAVAVICVSAVPGMQLGTGNGFGNESRDTDGNGELNIQKLMDSGIVYAAEDDLIFTDLAQSHWAGEAARIMTEKGVVKGYEDGSFRPDGKLTYGEFIKMLTVYHTGADIGNAGRGHWASFYYEEAVAKGLMTEAEIPESKLSAPVTREDTALLIARTFGNKALTNSDEILASISDVDASHKYAREIARAYGFGIITGYEDGSFRPLGELSRAEGVTVMYRLSAETARIYPDLTKAASAADGEKSAAGDGKLATNSGGNGAVSAEKREDGAVPIGSVITTFMDYMPHPFYKVPVIYDETYAEKWESTGEMENPYKDLKYCVILDEKHTGPDGMYANLSATLTKNLVDTEGITFSDEVHGRNVVLVCGSTAYQMESYNNTRYWIPESEDNFKLPKYDYVGFFQNGSDTIYLLKAEKVSK